VAKTLEEYCVAHSIRPSALTFELANYTRKAIPGSNMLIGELEASLLSFLIHTIGATRVLELGTFTGYSALCMAEQLPSDGELITIDVNSGTTALAQSYWDKSPHGKKIHARLDGGEVALAALKGEFDLIFVDADKVNYPLYVTWARDHLSARGVIVVDNTLWSGKVLSENPDQHTAKIMEATRIATGWDDFVATLLPVRDGMLLLKRRAN
jgi:caffeoyl-CoA O-methyltransferase